MKRIIFAAIILLAAYAAGCEGPKEVFVKADGDKMIDVRRGQRLKIELRANATTGYLWEMTEAVNKDVLRQMGKYRYVRDSRRIGAGGVQIFRFEPLRRGQARFVFEYRRSWEKDKKPAKKRVIRVIVH